MFRILKLLPYKTIILISTIIIISAVVLNKNVTLKVIHTSIIVKEEIATIGFPYPKTTLYSQIEGNINQISIKENQRVRKGETLIAFDNKKEEYELAKARAEYARSVNDGEAIRREKELALELAISILEKTKVTSPIDGYITKIYALSENYTLRNSKLVEILQSDEWTFLTKVDSTWNKYIYDGNITIKIPRLGIEKYIIEPEIKALDGMVYLKLDNELWDENIPLNEEAVYIIIEKKIDNLAWIQSNFVYDDNFVITKEGKKIKIEIMAKQDNMVLVKGLEENTILKGER